ncbi:MAG TPA: hypothetical protein ENO08_07825 [Candidatus Eisenbacteria bacterium]|uniref:SGNH/GDSL hydrolase family protein n=1 Tax=Eiseniibacteriota bacterium TaxID=2212470 RepID=A0A7V2AW61_UNCEI|nr:hypothetical protein [Candidatus Eisenbacteria bacterium]
MRNKRREAIVVCIATLAVCFLMLEIGLRVKENRSFDISEGEYVQYGNSFRLRKNMTKLNRWSTSTFTIKTNSLGARDKTTGDKELGDRPYVVFIGDSQVFGLGVDYEESFVGIFDDFASEQGIETLNLAVGGYFLLEQEEFFWDVMERLHRKPLAVFYTLNASSMNWFDSEHENTVVKNGYLFYRSNWMSAYVKMMIRNNLSTYVFFRDAFWCIYRRLNLRGGEVKVPRHFNLYSKDSRLHDQDAAERLEAHIDRFQSKCDELGIRTIYLYVPIADSFRIKEAVTKRGLDPDDYDITLYDRFIKDYCDRHGHTLLNPRPLLREYYEQGEVLDLVRDLHYNEFTNRVVGEYLIEQVFIEHGLF